MESKIKENIKNYEECLLKINKIKMELKNINKIKEKTENNLIKLFEKQDLKDTIITTNNFNIEYSVKNTTKGISKEFLRYCFYNFFEKKKIKVDITELLDFIYNSREVTEKNYIKSSNIKK